MKRYGLDPTGVVALANRFATSFGCAEVPTLSPMLVGKMGLKGVPGLVVEGKGLVRGPPPGASGSAGRGRGGRGGGRGAAGMGGGRGGFFDGPPRENGFGGPSSEERSGRGGPRGGRGFGRGGAGGGRGGRRGPGQSDRPREESGQQGEEPSRKRARR